MMSPQRVDFANPDTPWPLRAFNAATRPFAERLFALEPEELLRAARERTGLDDFGPAGWRQRYDLLMRALLEEARLSPLGRYNTRGVILSLLEARLKAEQLLKDHPEILDVGVQAPIIIYGLPRTGTTLLQRLIARDPGLRHLTYWESENPMPLGSVEKPLPEPDPRIRKAKLRLALLHWAAPMVIAMHEMRAEEADEELWLMAMDFASFFFTGGYSVPSYTAWMADADLTESYAYLYRMLQILQWYQPGERWILKCPQHLGHVRTLLKVFPDATLVQTHRDPCTAIASILSTIAYVARFNTERPDPVAVGRDLNRLLEGMLRQSIEQRPSGDGRFVDVQFRDLVEDPIAEVRRVYDRAGRELTPQSEAAMRAYLVAERDAKHGKHVYDLADFGLELAERREALRFYSERFGVPDDA
jgi:hypothetical protein